LEVNGVPVRFAVRMPTKAQQEQANRTLKNARQAALKRGKLPRSKAEALARQRGLWDTAKQDKYEALVRTLAGDAEYLQRATVENGRRAAIRMRVARAESRRMREPLNELLESTAEAEGQQARFDYLVSVCTYFADTGKPVFTTVQDYRRRWNEPVGLKAAWMLGAMLFDLDENFEENLPEERYLREHGLPESVFETR
jgi:hypothetical protein